MKIQEEYDTIYSSFKNTQPAFDELDWDGKELIFIHKKRSNREIFKRKFNRI